MKFSTRCLNYLNEELRNNPNQIIVIVPIEKQVCCGTRSTPSVLLMQDKEIYISEKYVEMKSPEISIPIYLEQTLEPIWGISTLEIIINAQKTRFIVITPEE
jgi:hypothetical protein